MICLLMALSLALHPIHTTLLEVQWDARSGKLDATLRVFQDDLRAAAAAARVSETEYVLNTVTIIAGGRPTVLEICGVRRAADAVLFCLQGRLSDARNVRFRNTALMELYADQFNIVRVLRPANRTLLLTRAAAEQAVN